MGNICKKSQCAAYALDTGIDFIIDDLTAVTVLPAEVIREKQYLKVVIKDLVGCAFKYDQIWLLVIEDNVPLDPGSVSSFLLATNNFPCSLIDADADAKAASFIVLTLVFL